MTRPRRDFCSGGGRILGRLKRGALQSSWQVPGWTGNKGFVVCSGADRSLTKGVRSGKRRMLCVEAAGDQTHTVGWRLRGRGVQSLANGANKKEGERSRSCTGKGNQAPGLNGMVNRAPEAVPPLAEHSQSPKTEFGLARPQPHPNQPGHPATTCIQFHGKYAGGHRSSYRSIAGRFGAER